MTQNRSYSIGRVALIGTSLLFPPIALVILLYKGCSPATEDSDAFLLLKTEKQLSSESKNGIMLFGNRSQSIFCYTPLWYSCIANDVLSFMNGCFLIKFSHTILGYNEELGHLEDFFFSTRRFLVDLGIFCFDSDFCPEIFERYLRICEFSG